MTKFTLSFLFLLIFSIDGFSQGHDSKANIYQWFDSQVGVENTRLFNGKEYIDRHRTINIKNKFLAGGTGIGAVLYDGQWFPNLQMRYNVFDDLLLVQLESNLGNNILELIKQKIEQFTFNGLQFINVNPIQSNSPVTGFYEILFENPQLSILKKHAKSITEKRDRQVTYFEFEPIEGHYAFGYKNIHYLLRSRNDIINVFPELKEEITSYYKDNSRMLRSRPDDFYIGLFRELALLLEGSNNLAR